MRIEWPEKNIQPQRAEAENQNGTANVRVTMHREKSLNSGVTSHHTGSTKSIRTTALYGNAICPTRRTFFSSSFLFSASFTASIVFILYESISRRPDRILRASTCKNFISLAYTPLYLRSFITFFRGVRSLFLTNNYATLLALVD